MSYFKKLQEFLRNKKEKLAKRPIGIISIIVVGSGAAGDPRSLYVQTDHDRYIFNCGEGTQRLCSEHHLKLGRVSHVFVTRPTWENVGGLPGVVMALRDQGAVQLALHGPGDLGRFFPSCQSIVLLYNLNISTPLCVEGGAFEDRALRVIYAPLVPEGSGREEECRTAVSLCFAVRVLAGRRVLLPQRCAELGVPATGAVRSRLKNGEDVILENGTKVRAEDVTAPAGSRRVVCPELCAARGVPPTGELLRKLKDGCTVTLPSGEEVRPEDVSVEQRASQPLFLVVDVPSERYITSLISSRILNENASEVCLVIHFTPRTVMSDPRYAQWMRQFSAAQHLSLGGGARVSGAVMATKQQVHHNLLLPMVFPLLENSGVPTDRRTSDHITTEEDIVMASALMQYRLLPHTGFDRSAEPRLDGSELVREVLARPNVEAALSALQGALPGPGAQAAAQWDEFPRLVFLGTGGAVPSALRNTACIVLELSRERSLLLDCAEGSVGQLLRLQGEAGVRRLLGSLRAVFLSHSHGDHVLGLPGLLRARLTLLPQPAPHLLVIAPEDLADFVRRIHDFFQPLHNNDVSFISTRELENRGQAADCVRDALQASEVRSAPVDHGRRGNAYALAVGAGGPGRERPWKITYSGDTAPCQSLEQLGAGSTLLVHEATLEDALHGLARAKRHSTPSEARDAARRMGAEFTVLTHFSQRYARVPRIDQLNDREPIGVAFDNMKVSLRDLPLLPLLLRPLRAIYHATIERLREKANRLRRPMWG